MKFFGLYLFTALVLTVGVYHGARPIGALCGLVPSAADAQFSGSDSAPASPAERVQTAQPPKKTSASALEAASPSVNPATATPSSASEAVAPAETALVPAQTGNGGTASPPEPTRLVASSAPPVPPATTGCKSWGLTLGVVSYYSAAGDKRGQLPVGSLMDIEGSCDSSRGEMIRGRVERDGAMIGPYLVAASELVQFSAPRSEVSPETQSLLKQYFDVKGQLAERIAELKKETVDLNPYAAAFREAKQRYNEFGAREKELTERRDRSVGAERMRCIDQLRAMIPENTRLLRAVEDSKTRYNSWKAGHPVAAPDTSKDPRVQELQRRLAAIEPRVKEFVN